MAKRKQIEETSIEPAANANNAPEQAQEKSELPTVSSPSISPATPTPAIEAMPALESIVAVPESATADAASSPSVPSPRFVFTRRHKRNVLLAASVAMAAAFGAVIGAAASGGFAAPARTDAAGLEEYKMVQQSISRLTREVTTLKANIEAASKSAHTQIAKISERFDRASAGDITGSISAPQTMTAPLPTPRPSQPVAAAETQPPARQPVVRDWSIRDAHDGFVYVQSHGEIYQVSLGAPLPGLGAVETIKRQDGRWVVVTPKGIIVSMRDRRYFESF